MSNFVRQAELPDEFCVVDLSGSSVFVFSARSAIRVTHPARSIDEILREQVEGPVMANDGAGIGSPVLLLGVC